MRDEQRMRQPALARAGLCFDEPVATNGYRWWYLDAFSADGRAGLTVIAFIGSVFSPYYARARKRGPADPENHCSVNVIFYGPRKKYWTLTERGRNELERDVTTFRVGPSCLHWDGDALHIDFNEWAVPLPRRVKGSITVIPLSLNNQCVALDSAAQHRWWPAAPVCDVDVSCPSLGIGWRGDGYLDSNGGVVPLESTFTRWHWMRRFAAGLDGEIHYDTTENNGRCAGLTLRHDAQGQLSDILELEQPPELALEPTRWWRMHRPARPELGARVLATFEDTPFYARSRLLPTASHATGEVMHESLDMQRFTRPWVQMLLPFRMPRRAGW